MYPQEDIRLSGMEIRAGYAFWTEDESELHRENRRLEAANEILSEENSLIRAENELKEKKARLDAQNRVYDRIAAELFPRQKRIESLLEDYCFGTYHDDRLIAFTMMIANRISHRNYGTYVGYPEERQKHCVSLEISLVDRDYREFGLQRLFVSLREEIAKAHGAKEALVTIAPGNDYSLHNLLNSGYQIMDTRPLYEGAVRHILSKQL